MSYDVLGGITVTIVDEIGIHFEVSAWKIHEFIANTSGWRRWSEERRRQVAAVATTAVM